MSNQDLLKEAIAEAKTIREAAIANAKVALEESLTPHLKDMLAAKLQEMEEAEEDIMNEEEEDLINNPQGPTAKGNVAEGEDEEESEEEESEEDLEIEDMSVEDLKDLIRDIVAQEVGSESEEAQEELPADDMEGMESEEEEIDINELLAEIAQEDVLEEGFEEWLDRVSAEMDKFGKTNPTIQAIEKAIEKAQAAMDKFGKTNPTIQAIEKGITAAQAAKEKYIGKSPLGRGHRISEESKDLNEALRTVAELRTQLQEVNLLNAKLLYVNKVLKVNNLTESQKVNIVTAFDKAETVKEVKLVYETVSKNLTSKQTPIKEHRSFASKAAGTAKTAGKVENNQIISEQVARWQKLAGIIK